MKLKLLFLLLTALPFSSFSQNKLAEQLIGKHMLSLQWISWEEFGSVDITATEKENTYKIKGSQQIKHSYLKIAGTITPVSEKHLLFKGTIETCISHINKGEPCLREGEFNFKVTKNRKYWRLQEMQNPCDNVADYVDIYFK